MGFAIPVESWLKNELKELVHEHLSESSIRAHGLFDYKAVTALKESFFNGRSEKYLKVWYLLMFQMWYKKLFLSAA